MKKNKNILEKSYTIGSWIQIGNPEFTRMMAASGFEILVMDTEDGSIMEKDLPKLFDALKAVAEKIKNDSLIKDYL